MRKPAHVLLAALAGLLGFFSQTADYPKFPATREARSFMPGYWGYEHGAQASSPSPGAWLTRSMSGVSGKAAERVWSEFNNLGPSLHFSHSLSHIVRTEDFEHHSDWFPLVGGKRYKPDPSRLNWQPDLGSEAVAERAAEMAAEAFNRGAMSFGLGINDALIFGESPETLKWIQPPRYFRGKPNYSNLIFSFTNRVAEKVETKLSPQVGRSPWVLGCLAYYWCEQVPDFPMHPRIVPFLCADRAQAYDPAFFSEEKALQKAWAKKGSRRLGIYDYTYGYGFLIPRIHTRVIIEHLRHARSNGFTDYFAEMNSNWGLDGPQPWLVAQLLSHPEADGQALLDEYYLRFFAEAAAPMRAFFERCELLWMSQPGPVDWLKYYRNESQAELFPSSECAKLRRLLNEAALLARSEKVRQRVAFVSASFGATEGLARMWESKKALSLSLAKNQSVARIASDLAALEQAESGLISCLATLAREHPLALHKGAPPDFFWMSPASAARALLSETPTASVRETPERRPADYADSFEAPTRPGQWIAGLEFRAELPEGWTGKMEPAEAAITRICPEAARTGRAGLRLADNKHVSVFSWHKLDRAKRSAFIQVWARGRVSPAARVALQISFLDAEGKLHPMVHGMRYIPETWNAEGPWTRLSVHVEAPSDATWISVSILGAYMLKGDRVDFDDVEILFH